MIPYTQEESRLARLLNTTALVCLVLYVLMLVGAYQSAASPFFTEPPFVTNSTAGMGLLGLLAWFAAADLRRMRLCIYTLIAGLALGALACIVLLFSPHAAGQSAVLIVGALVCGAAAGAIFWFMRPVTMPDSPWMPWATGKGYTGWERAGQIVCGGVGVLTLVGGVVIVALAITGNPFFRQPLMIAGCTIKLGALAICTFVSMYNIRRYTEMLTLFILGNLLSFIAILVSLNGIANLGDRMVTLLGVSMSLRQVMSQAALLDAVVVIGFTILKIGINRSVLDHLSFFNPFQFRALEAISESLIEGGASEKVLPYQIVLRADRHLNLFPSSRLWLAKLAVTALELAPLMTLHPPLSFLLPASRREFIDRYFKRDIVNPRGLYWLLDRPGLRRMIDFIEGAVRFNMQLTYLGYYSDPAVQSSIGYVPFSERPKDFPVKPIRRYPPLNVVTPADLRREGLDTITSADVVIIGSGAAGAILAEQLADAGRDVLLLEKGAYVKPDDFSEDEVDMIGRLYSDGALQISQALRFTILQGSCVGGTTVVNNAVCFDTPDSVLERWNDPNGLNAGIDLARFKASQVAVKERMSVRSIKESSGARPWEKVINPGDGVVSAGVQNFLSPDTYAYDIISANITDCLGCGYCNMGCKYGRKLSMLDEVLPKAQQTHGDKFRIISEAEAVKLKGSGGSVKEIVVRLRDKRQLVILNPKTVIVSAGTIASSWLLMRSGIGNGELPVGRGLCFNMGSPLHGYFEQKLDSYAGLQIAHYLKLNDHPGFVYETWYNPPVAQALAMPGWLDTHFQNMARYDHMAGVGVLVGTETNGYVTPALILRGTPDVVYTPTERDLDKLVDALMILGRIMFAGGAQEVFVSTRSYKSYKRGEAVMHGEDELGQIRKLVKDDRDILLGTGHPQGGNPISKNRGKGGHSGGVVAPDFKVYGYDNLYVCDASVFPGSTTVNPQLTVMTMAHYASTMMV